MNPGIQPRLFWPLQLRLAFGGARAPDQDHLGTRKPVWFALAGDLPLAFFAGIWTPHACVRKIKTGWEEFEAFGFLTTDAAEPVKTYHREAMPVILTTAEERDLWLSDAPWEEVRRLQRPLADGALGIVPPPPQPQTEPARLL